MTKPFTYASREEIAVVLNTIEGTIPTDLMGHVYINSPCGTVNNPPPQPEDQPDGKHNSEYGEMLFNGDAMLFRFDMNEPGKLSVQSSLLKTPCYYADYATRYGTSYHAEGKYFRGMGLARTSEYLGSRNQLNTALNLFKFASDEHTRVTVNFDAGRFYEVDASTMILKTPIGTNEEWLSEFPPALEYTFPLTLSTAHPSFDPVTKELFTVNYGKSASNLAFEARTLTQGILHEKELVEAYIKKLYDDLEKRKLKGCAVPGFILELLSFLSSNKPAKNTDGTLEPFDVDGALQNAEQNYRDVFGMENVVYLLRWTGTGKLDKWRVVDKNGQNLYIAQCMHQTNFSKDYIVLVDSSVKFTLDIMFSVPFPNQPWLDELLRWITSKTMLPETPLYIINRASLQTGVETVTAQSFTAPLETVHYSMDYDNPNNHITLHTSHNTASCAAEWIRPYDTLAIDRTQAAYKNTVGLMTCGEMDIGRIGKFVVDGETGIIIEQFIVHSKGFEGDIVQNVKAHTWAVGLNTYRDILSADKVVPRIRKNYWQSYGLDKRMLTHFIWSLYYDYKNRIIDADKLLDYTKQGVPFCLLRQDTDTMKIDEDYWLFTMNENLRSLQFVPRNRANGIPEGVDVDMDGYILCTMVIGPPNLPPDINDYRREVWLFDAAALHKGPVCKLAHPSLQFAFTIHSAWSPDCASSPTTYHVPVKPDYDWVINKFSNIEKKAWMEQFMTEHVYPNFDKTV